MSNNSTLALITARGGSKRLPGKNIKALGGKPLIAWTIEAAISASTIDRVIVSTDCHEIAEVARNFGAEVPFLRPSELSGDHSSHYDVIAHTLDWLIEEASLPQTCVLLQPTSPFRSCSIIDQALLERLDVNAESMVSVSRVTEHPAVMFRMSGQGTLSNFLPPKKGYQRSQDQEELFVLNGAIYAFSPHSFRQRKSVLSPSPHGFAMQRFNSIDIDNAEDFVFAETILAAQPNHLE